MFVKYKGEQCKYFTKDKTYFAWDNYDELVCEDDTGSSHVLKENEYDTIWFEQNFTECDEKGIPLTANNEEERNPFSIGSGLYEVVYKKSELDLKSHKFIGVCENFNARGLCAFWNKEDKMLLVDYKNILGLYPM